MDFPGCHVMCLALTNFKPCNIKHLLEMKYCNNLAYTKTNQVAVKTGDFFIAQEYAALNN